MLADEVSEHMVVWLRGIQITGGLSTDGRTILGRLERGVKTSGGKTQTIFMINPLVNQSSNAKEEDSVNQGSAASDNSNPQ